MSENIKRCSHSLFQHWIDSMPNLDKQWQLCIWLYVGWLGGWRAWCYSAASSEDDYPLALYLILRIESPLSYCGAERESIPSSQLEKSSPVQLLSSELDYFENPSSPSSPPLLSLPSPRPSSPARRRWTRVLSARSSPRSSWRAVSVGKLPTVPKSVKPGTGQYIIDSEKKS